MSEIMQSLWIGKPLSKLEQLCLKSFVDNGHEVHLYVYDKVGNIPTGVIVKDGNEILDKSEIFRYKNGSVSAFSNLFRFTLLYKKGGYWIDADLLCVRPIKLNQSYVFSSEPDEQYSNNIINAGLIKLPKGSKEASLGMEIQRKRKKDILDGKIQWGSGPETVKNIVETFDLSKYVLPWWGICNCFYEHFPTLFNPKYKVKKAINTVSEMPKDMICIHLWNEVLRRNNVDKNSTFHNASLIEFFKRKHNIN
jgi:hypothetical protein